MSIQIILNGGPHYVFRDRNVDSKQFAKLNTKIVKRSLVRTVFVSSIKHRLSPATQTVMASAPQRSMKG
jgi:hypothetical protein